MPPVTAVVIARRRDYGYVQCCKLETERTKPSRAAPGNTATKPTLIGKTIAGSDGCRSDSLKVWICLSVCPCTYRQVNARFWRNLEPIITDSLYG
jgi:hypothetical protein